jgi:predicted  nucleic acid-binding Zn-ribbon protein
MKIQIPVSVGELIDKITILEIKSLFTDDKYVERELNELRKIKDTLKVSLIEHTERLREVNQKLWKIEDKIRKLEKEQRFDSEFIELARSVYILNDERSKVKKEINEITNSTIREVKVY